MNTFSNANKTTCLPTKLIRFGKTSWGAICLYTASVIGVSLCLIVVIVFVRNWNTPIVNASHKYLTMTQVISQLLLFSGLLLQVPEPTFFTCIARLVLCNMLSTLIFSIILVKNELFIRVFKIRHLSSRRRSVVNQSMTVGLLIFMTICGLGLTAAVIFLERHSLVTKEYSAQGDTLTITCKDGGWNVLQVAFFMALCLFCGVQAFRVRKLPEFFNEASLIAFTMFSTVAIMCLWIVLHNSMSDLVAKSSLTTGVIMTIDFIIVVLMHGYKVFVIVFRPHNNCRASMKRQTMKYSDDNTRKHMRRLLSKRESEV